jgi:hypothetical protein
VDGGLDIPHSEKRFVGYSADDKALDAEVRGPSTRAPRYGGWRAVLFVLCPYASLQALILFWGLCPSCTPAKVLLGGGG